MSFPVFDDLVTPTPDGVITDFFTSVPYASGSLNLYVGAGGGGLLIDKDSVTETDPLTGAFNLLPDDGPVSAPLLVVARYIDPSIPDGPVVDTLVIVINEPVLSVVKTGPESLIAQIDTASNVSLRLEDTETLLVNADDTRPIIVEVCECP